MAHAHVGSAGRLLLLVQLTKDDLVDALRCYMDSDEAYKPGRWTPGDAELFEHSARVARTVLGYYCPCDEPKP